MILVGKMNSYIRRRIEVVITRRTRNAFVGLNWHEGSVYASLRSLLNKRHWRLATLRLRQRDSDKANPKIKKYIWRRIEVVITRRTRNAFVGLYRHEGSNPSVSVSAKGVPKGIPFVLTQRDSNGVCLIFKKSICISIRINI